MTGYLWLDDVSNTERIKVVKRENKKTRNEKWETEMTLRWWSLGWKREKRRFLPLAPVIPSHTHTHIHIHKLRENQRTKEREREKDLSWRDTRRKRAQQNVRRTVQCVDERKDTVLARHETVIISGYITTYYPVVEYGLLLLYYTTTESGTLPWPGLFSLSLSLSKKR